MEPSDMYIRDMRLSATYKALYECYRYFVNNSLHQLISFNANRIAKDSTNGNLLLELLEANYMSINEDSAYEKYALPLAKRIQKIQSSDAYLKIFAIDDQFVILKKLKRNDEALKVLETYNASNRKEPVILFDLARMNFFTKNNQAGFAYLKRAKQNLNDIFNKQIFIAQLKNSDFDEVRNTPEFNKLIK